MSRRVRNSIHWIKVKVLSGSWGIWKRRFAGGNRREVPFLVREYLHRNVYDAFLERMDFIFKEFDNIYISFSGGKDSGLLLNLVLDYRNRHYPGRTLGVFHQDFEAQYTVTTEYVERTFERIKDQVEPFWVCLPMATRTALSSYEMYWYPWDDTKKEIWVREMPKKEYVINLENNRITTYRYRMPQEDLAKQFGRWYRNTQHWVRDAAVSSDISSAR